MLHETDTAITPSDIAQLRVSQPAIEGLQALHQASNGIVTADSFVAARDLIITILNVENGSRQSNIQDITIQMYAAARKGPNTGKKVVIVPKNKRACQGPAKLVISLEVQEWLATYLCEMRYKFTNADEERLLIKIEGEEFKDVGRRITAFWKKGGIRPDINVTATRIRKMVSTTVHTKDLDKAPVVRWLTRLPKSPKCEPPWPPLP